MRGGEPITQELSGGPVTEELSGDQDQNQHNRHGKQKRPRAPEEPSSTKRKVAGKEEEKEDVSECDCELEGVESASEDEDENIANKKNISDIRSHGKESIDKKERKGVTNKGLVINYFLEQCV